MKFQLGEAYAFSGDTLNARSIIQDLQERSKTPFIYKSYLAVIFMALGEQAKAFELLEEGLKKRELMIHVLDRYFVSMYKMRDDPRYISLTERMWVR